MKSQRKFKQKPSQDLIILLMLTPSVVKTRSVKFSTKNLIKAYLGIGTQAKFGHLKGLPS